MIKRYPSEYGQWLIIVTVERDISDLDIPLQFLVWIFTNLNAIRSGEIVYEDAAFDQLKYFLGAMSQRVFREMTERR